MMQKAISPGDRLFRFGRQGRPLAYESARLAGNFRLTNNPCGIGTHPFAIPPGL